MYYDFKYVEYIGNNVFKVMITKFLYSYDDEFGGFKIDKELDLINIDLSIEYFIYIKDRFYLLTNSTFDKNYFCRCQQPSIRLYKIDGMSFTSMSNDEIIDLFDISWGRKEDLGYYRNHIKSSEFSEMADDRKKIYAVYNYLGRMESEYRRTVRMLERSRKEGKPLESAIEETVSTLPNIDHPVYNNLIKPFLDQPLFVKDNEEVLDRFETEYSSNFWYFFYENDNKDFNLSLVPVYFLKRGDYKFLYIKKSKEPMLYRELDMCAPCCGSGNYFFYRIKLKRWIDMTEDDLKKRLGLYCVKCDKYLEKWEREVDKCFTCY